MGCECDGMLAASSMSLNNATGKNPRAPVHRIAVRHWPSAGFHWRLVELAAAWFRRHPLKPLPMVKL